MSPSDQPRAPLPTRVSDTLPLDRAYAHALDEGLRQLGLELPDPAREAIDGHVRLLLAWTAAINLTAIREPAAMATLHVIDSLSGVAPIVAGLDRSVRILDLGSGGGYPGLVLAAAIPDSKVVLLDSVAKKVRFLQVAIDAARLADRVRAVAARAEALAGDPAHRAGYDVVVARAVGALPELVELALPLLVRGGLLVAWKRGPLDAEVAAARRAAIALGGGTISSVPVEVAGLVDHRLVVVRKDGVTPPGFPRDPATRRRHPL